MEKTIYFYQMFPDYEIPQESESLLRAAIIIGADIDPESRSVSVDLFSEIYIPERYLITVRRELSNRYGLRNLELNVRHPESQISQIEPNELRDLFVNHNSMARGCLAGAQWLWDETHLNVQLKGNGKEALLEHVPSIARQLGKRFGCHVEITIQSGVNLEGAALFEAMEKHRSQLVEACPAPIAQPEKTATAMVTTSPSDTIFGKFFRGNAVPMKDIDLNMGTVIVEGRVFFIEHKELTKRNAVVIKFDMTDHTSSIRISRFLERKEAEPIMNGIKVGDVVRVSGRLMIDNYTNEMVLKPNAIIAGSMPKRKDTVVGDKRVELHMHTVMSSMDALTSTKDAIKQAAAWGHKAIAITDHGCVQSFTDALHVVEGKGAPKVAGTDETIKILYGVEGYYINDVDDRIVVRGNADMAFDGEYVAFDLETTGLHPRFDKIIEIGAVVMKQGKELDRFQTFVDPGQRLTREVSELTGISDDMLHGAPKIEEVLPDFLDFIGGRPLVAHNASFDLCFVTRECQRQGVAFTFTAVDTLPLSQNLLPKLNKHKLDIVAKEFELGDFNHHRAADDAVICGQIAVKLFERLEQMDVHTLQQINAAMIPLRMVRRRDSRHAQHIILFAKNQQGLRNLYHLISDSNLKYYKQKPRIFKSELMKLREGLIIGSACEANEIFQEVIFGTAEDELMRIASFYDYLEVQPIANNRFMLDKGVARHEEDLKEFNRTIVQLGERMGKPVVATGDVHFLNPEDEVFRHILLATKGFDDADKPNPLYFRTTDDMLKEFSYLGEEKAYEVVVTNPNLIADMCDTIRPVPHNLFAPKIENSVEDLNNLVYGKLHRLYGENPPELFVKRVETELHDIISCHYDVIYMSAQRLVQNSLENGYLVGSRGSVGSSIVAYMSGITEVNALPPHYRCDHCHKMFLTPPELASDVFDEGITLSGGGAQLFGLAEVISDQLRIRTTLADEPDLCVAHGLSALIDDPDRYENIDLVSGSRSDLLYDD